MKPKLVFTRANHGVMVQRGKFYRVFLTWKSIRELVEVRDLPRVQSWLVDFLADGSCSADLIAQAARKHGYGHDILWRARRTLGVVTRKRKGVRCWKLPELFQ